MENVYSCSIFFNELDLLELKLETLKDVVDYFVIIEAFKTHSGIPKPLIFWDNRERFYKFKDKIIHFVSYDTPDDYTNLLPDMSGTKDPFYNLVIKRVNEGNWWDHRIPSYGRDTFEKESLIRPLSICADDDIILLSDTDEIVRPEILEEVINCFDGDKIYHFQHDVFYYYLNLQKDEPWYGTIALSFKKFKEKSFCEMRTNKSGYFVNYGGWHFSFQNGIGAIKLKLESYGEQSLNLEHIKQAIPYSVENAIELGRDLFGRPCKFTQRNINDGTFPKYLVEHQNDIYKGYIK